MSFFIRVALPVIAVIAVVWWAPWRYVTQAMELPSGFTFHRAEDYRLAYPVNWQKREGNDAQRRPFVEFNGPATPQGAYSGQVRVTRWERWPYRLQDKVAQFRVVARDSGFIVISESPVLIEDARSAHRIDTRHRTTTPSGAPVWVRQTEILAVTEEGTLLDFIVSAPEGGERQARLADILASIRVEAKNRIIDTVNRGIDNIRAPR